MRGISSPDPRMSMQRAPQPQAPAQAPVIPAQAPVANVPAQQAEAAAIAEDLNRFETDFKRMYEAVNAAAGEIEFDATFLVDKQPQAYQQLLIARASIANAKASMLAAWEIITTPQP